MENKEKIEIYINKATKLELESATGRYGSFISLHEAHSVITEEFEECQEELLEIEKELKDFWKKIRNNENVEELNHIKYHAENLVKEGIQLLAMCYKFKNSFEVVKSEES